MTIHREGYPTIALVTILLIALNVGLCYALPTSLGWLWWLVAILSLGFWIFILSFFRVPARKLTLDDTKIICPADGKVVVIEETYDEEYFKDKRLQVSIFMSPLNVHLNRNGLSGSVLYSQYHKGKYLVAWDPKSSTQNERHSVVYSAGGKEVLVKQIAGAVARRIVNYLKPGMQVKQGDEMGFIKFGSRVDLLLPIGTKLHVSMGQVVQGGVTPLADW